MIARENPVFLEHAVEHALVDEIDQCICLRVDVVAIEKHFCIPENLAQSPCQWSDIAEECFVRAKRVELESLRGVWSEILNSLERLCGHTHLFVQLDIAILELARLIQKAEIGTLHVEADSSDRSFVLGEMREHRRKEPLDCACFRGEARHSGNIEVCCLGTEKKIRVEIDGRVGCSGVINTDRNSCVRAFL